MFSPSWDGEAVAFEVFTQQTLALADEAAIVLRQLQLHPQGVPTSQLVEQLREAFPDEDIDAIRKSVDLALQEFVRLALAERIAA